MGRISRYETHVEPFLDDIGKWKVSKTEEQIAEMLGISYASLQKYKKIYSELNEALLFGNKKKCDDVESAMYKRAKGYDYYEEKEVIDKNTGQIVTLKTKKHMPADPRAAEFIEKLNNPLYSGESSYTMKMQAEELELKKKKDKREEENAW